MENTLPFMYSSSPIRVMAVEPHRIPQGIRIAYADLDQVCLAAKEEALFLELLDLIQEL